MKTINYLYIVCIALLLALSATGCGYRFSGGGTLPSGSGDICISIFKNRSSESLFENTITNDIIYEFTRNGQKVSRNEAGADSVLTGTILSVTTESATRTSSLTSVEKKVKVHISAVLKSRKGKILWENSELRYEQLYEADAANNEKEKSYRKEALAKMSERFAPALYANMTEDF